MAPPAKGLVRVDTEKKAWKAGEGVEKPAVEGLVVPIKSPLIDAIRPPEADLSSDNAGADEFIEGSKELAIDSPVLSHGLVKWSPGPKSGLGGFLSSAASYASNLAAGVRNFFSWRSIKSILVQSAILMTGGIPGGGGTSGRPSPELGPDERSFLGGPRWRTPPYDAETRAELESIEGQMHKIYDRKVCAMLQDPKRVVEQMMNEYPEYIADSYRGGAEEGPEFSRLRSLLSTMRSEEENGHQLTLQNIMVVPLERLLRLYAEGRIEVNELGRVIFQLPKPDRTSNPTPKFPDPTPIIDFRMPAGASEVTLGRVWGDLIVQSPQVSAKHARIYRDLSGVYWIQDLDSANGTYIDGLRLGIDPHTLKPGDVIMIANTKIKFLG